MHEGVDGHGVGPGVAVRGGIMNGVRTGHLMVRDTPGQEDPPANHRGPSIPALDR
ncbi:hypothetical protein [Arthrobacter sp. 2MCAF14]|uniref:hypothetical protein n=1 Tax=Arthrobacter sp. 2MCAF14 TaxID=3232982 RepID=UPI003F912AE2